MSHMDNWQLYNFMVIMIRIAMCKLGSLELRDYQELATLELSINDIISCGLLRKSCYVRDFIFYSQLIEKQEPWRYQEYFFSSSSGR